MTTRFTVDLLHSGRAARTPQEWFAGPRGGRRLIFFSLGGLISLVLVLLGGILPTYWHLREDIGKIESLKRKLAASEADLEALRTNLTAVSAEARRRVRWTELLDAFSQQSPLALGLRRVELTQRTAPGRSDEQAQQPPRTPERILQIEAQTPLRPGSPALLEVAKFLAGLMREPAIRRRFQLKSWEIRPPARGAEAPPLLQVTITFTERSQ